VKQAYFFVAVLALAGCAQLPPKDAAQPPKTPVSTDIVNFRIPPDALGARDPQLTAVLVKVGALAAAQKQPTTILVTALGADFPYLNQAIWRGIPAQHPVKISLENLTAGANQTYSVSVKPTP
jgi:hypothetical protein